MSRTQAHMGDLITDLTATATNAAQSAAQSYAESLYEQYSVQIWSAGIVIAFWVIWVSTRDTCKKADS